MLKKFYYTLFALLIILNFTLLLKVYRINKKNEGLESQILEKKAEQSKLMSKILNNENKSQLINNFKINPEIKLFDINNNKFKLSSLVSVKPKLVVFYNTNGCGICMETQLVYLKEFIKKIGEQNIIIITNHESSRNLMVYKKTNAINASIFSVQNLGIPFDIESTVFEFIIDNSFAVKDFFIPETSLPDFSMNYYNTLFKKYFTQIEN